MLQAFLGLDFPLDHSYNIAMDSEDRKFLYQKRANGSTYVYEVLDHHWDKEKKQARTKQVYVGKLDPATGKIIPKKRLGDQAGAAMNEAVTARTTISGPALVLTQADRSIGLSKHLKRACPHRWKEILSLAWYLLGTNAALSHAETWCESHEVPSPKRFSSQRITELLDTITEDDRQTFFDIWGKSIASRDYLCYDITSISSYAEHNEYIRWGYNRDKEALPQLNLGMVYGQQSMLPVLYRETAGSISDVSTLKHVLDQFLKLNYPKLHLVMDRGFYSKANLDALAEGGQHFTIGVPIHLKWIQAVIDEDRDLIDGTVGYHERDGEVIYAHTRLRSWGDSKRRCYLHLYFDPEKMAKDRIQFDKNLAMYRHELLEDRRVAEHEEMYTKFFIWKTTPKRGLQVEFNHDGVQAGRKKYVGFSAILSTKFKDPLEALTVYREKDVVEKCFDDLKNELDCSRLRVHTSQRMKNRLFIQFIALILLSAIRQTMKSKLPKSNYSVRSLLWELESLTTIHYSGKYKNKLSEITKAQRAILEAFEVQIPT